jgi:hypothetical protein
LIKKRRILWQINWLSPAQKKNSKNQRRMSKNIWNPGLHPWHQRVKLQEKYIIQFSNFYIKFARSHKKKHFQVFIALIAFFFLSLMTAFFSWFFRLKTYWNSSKTSKSLSSWICCEKYRFFWNYFKSMIKNFISKFAEILQE